MEKSIVPPSIGNISASVKIILEQMPQNRVDAFIVDYQNKSKQVSLAYIFALLLGSHYAYFGKWGLWILFWLTGAGCGIWMIVDLIRMSKMVNDYNNELAHKILIQLK